jgi:hypothetical protein
MWFWLDAMQGARLAAVRALQETGNAAARRPKPQTGTIYFVGVLRIPSVVNVARKEKRNANVPILHR